MCPAFFFAGKCQSIFAFLRIAETLYRFVFTQFQTENRSPLFLELP
jgi:hypothetical protein